MCLYVHACMSCVRMRLRGCMKEEGDTVPQRGKWAGQAVMMDQ